MDEQLNRIEMKMDKALEKLKSSTLPTYVTINESGISKTVLSEIDRINSRYHQ